LIGHTVEDRGYETPCWIANKKPQENGYVVLPWHKDGEENSTRIGAHRLAYMRGKGPIPEGFHIDHLCRVPTCINPDHLEAVLPVENVRRSSQTKLNPDLVREIRTSSETGIAIANRLGVSRALISRVRQGIAWRDIE
jgi:hypothetical protein